MKLFFHYGALILVSILLSIGLQSVGTPFWIRMVVAFLLGFSWNHIFPLKLDEIKPEDKK